MVAATGRLDADGWVLVAALQGANGSAADGGSGFLGVQLTQLGLTGLPTVTSTGSLDTSYFNGARHLLPEPPRVWRVWHSDHLLPGGPRHDDPGALVGRCGIRHVHGHDRWRCPSPVAFGSPYYVAHVVICDTVAAGSHVVSIAVAWSSSNIVGFFGVKGQNASGVIVNNYSVTGKASLDYTPTATTFGAPGLWQGGANDPADLLIYALGANDVYNATVTPTYADNLERFLAAATDDSADHQRDILVLLPHIGTHEADSSGHANYADRRAARTVATLYGAACVNINPTLQNSYAAAAAANCWGVGTTGTGANGSSSIHPSNTGHLYQEQGRPARYGNGVGTCCQPIRLSHRYRDPQSSHSTTAP